jgi:hypothetical protein
MERGFVYLPYTADGTWQDIKIMRDVLTDKSVTLSTRDKEFIVRLIENYASAICIEPSYMVQLKEKLSHV